MQLTLRTVDRSKGNIRFSARVDVKALRDFVPVLYEVLNRGFSEVTLDFRRSERAYAEAMLPIICLVDHRRRRGNSFRVLLPEMDYLRQLFVNTNWAFFLDPAQPKGDLRHPQHLPVRRYTTHPEQQDVVRDVMDVVLRNMELSRDSLNALEWSVNELTDNVLNHARSRDGGLVQVSTFREDHKVVLVVADAGRGIPVAMREAFPNLRTDVDAISEAVKAGVTSVPESGQGNGLAGSLRIAEQAEGSFNITSGEARLTVYKDGPSRAYRTKTTRAQKGFHFPGTAVTTELSTDREIDIKRALDLGAMPYDVVDLSYTSDSGDLIIKVAEESLGVGTRHAGVELRRKCLNLLRADPGKRLVLDWTGVPLISSSFADEAVGKLFVDMGPTTFATRVNHIGAEDLVRSLFDRAVMQRVVQEMQAADD